MAHLMGSCFLPAGSKEARKACRGETLRTETNGSKANKTEMPVPKIIPSKMADHEILVVIVTGKKSLRIKGKNC